MGAGLKPLTLNRQQSQMKAGSDSDLGMFCLDKEYFVFFRSFLALPLTFFPGFGFHEDERRWKAETASRLSHSIVSSLLSEI